MFLEYKILQSLFHKPGWVGAIHKCQPLCKLHCGQLAAGFLLGTVISHQAIAPICVHTQAKIWPQSFQPPKSYKDVKNKLNTMKGQICLGPFVTECSSVISKSKYEHFLPRRNLATHNESRTVKSPMIIRKIITVNCDLSWFNDKHNNPSMQTLKEHKTDTCPRVSQGIVFNGKKLETTYLSKES